MHSGRDVSMRLLVGDGTPKLAQIFAYGKRLYPCIMLLHGASDLGQRCMKTRSSKDGCTILPTKYHRPYSKNHPKNPFGGPFNVKFIIQGALHKSHVNGATKLKLYSYIGIGKYLGNGVCQNFSARRRPGGAGPLNANLGPPILFRKLLEPES